MKHFTVVLFVVGFILALPLSHSAMAKGKRHKKQRCQEKVLICHVNGSNDTIPIGSHSVITFGRVIKVSKRAVRAHERHGDSTAFDLITEEMRDEFEETFGINLPNPGCIFVRALN